MLKNHPNKLGKYVIEGIWVRYRGCCGRCPFRSLFVHPPREPRSGLARRLDIGQCRGRGGHLALLHRRLEDIAAAPAPAREIFAITEESLECPGVLSAGARNLLRAGFRLRDVRVVWQPPEDLLTPEKEDEDEHEDEWGGGDDDDGDGPDEDHHFLLDR